MYAIVRVGGKQYRVEKGDSLLVDRMPEEEGATVRLEPLLFRPDGDDEAVIGGDDLGNVKVEATVAGHVRGPKVHVLKFKPKRGYKRRQGHRSELTRLEIGEIALASPARKPKAERPEGGAEQKPAAKKPAAKKTAAKKPDKEESDGA